MLVSERPCSIVQDELHYIVNYLTGCRMQWICNVVSTTNFRRSAVEQRTFKRMTSRVAHTMKRCCLNASEKKRAGSEFSQGLFKRSQPENENKIYQTTDLFKNFEPLRMCLCLCVCVYVLLLLQNSAQRNNVQWIAQRERINRISSVDVQTWNAEQKIIDAVHGTSWICGTTGIHSVVGWRNSDNPSLVLCYPYSIATEQSERTRRKGHWHNTDRQSATSSIHPSIHHSRDIERLQMATSYQIVPENSLRDLCILLVWKSRLEAHVYT